MNKLVPQDLPTSMIASVGSSSQASGADHPTPISEYARYAGLSTNFLDSAPETPRREAYPFPRFDYGLDDDGTPPPQPSFEKAEKLFCVPNGHRLLFAAHTAPPVEIRTDSDLFDPDSRCRLPYLEDVLTPTDVEMYLLRLAKWRSFTLKLSSAGIKPFLLEDQEDGACFEDCSTIQRTKFNCAGDMMLQIDSNAMEFLKRCVVSDGPGHIHFDENVSLRRVRVLSSPLPRTSPKSNDCTHRGSILLPRHFSLLCPPVEPPCCASSQTQAT